MSFSSPLALLCLFAVPLAILVHLATQRRRRRYPVRFPALATLASVVSAEPQWRRHAPFALLTLALAVLAFSLARPQRTIAVPVQRASVVLVTDVSRSMSATDVSPTRLEAARSAAQGFLDKVPAGLRVGLVAFSDAAQTLQTPTTDHELVSSALDTLQPINGTFTGAGLQAALDDLQFPRGSSREKRPPSAIVLLSDGVATDGTRAFNVAGEARRLGVPIYTVALGTEQGTIVNNGRLVPVQPDPEALRRIASLSDGEAFMAEDADQLTAVYDRLGSQIGTKSAKQEITVWFAGAALLLLGAALVSSLRFGGRLP